MWKGRELASFRKNLLGWFKQFKRDLPWRRTKDPYRIWVSEIMLQQTRVAAMIPYYERFLARFPDVRALAQAPEEEVLQLWSGLGYYSRARNLRKAAMHIVAAHGGEFPKDKEAVQELPGVGPYTGAAILSIAFGAKHAVLDGNVARVLARLGAIRGDLRAAGRWQLLQKTANDLLEAREPGDWNQAMMELGATVCTPRAPQCLLCPVAKFCAARESSDPESFPEKRVKREGVEVVLAAAVFENSRGETLLLPPPDRPKGKSAEDDIAALVSAMWHFPTAAVRKDPQAELRSLLRRIVASKNTALELVPLAKVRHTVTYRNITALPFRVSVAKLPRVSGAKTLNLEDFSMLPISNLTRKIARAAAAAMRPKAKVANEERLLIRAASVSAKG